MATDIFISGQDDARAIAWTYPIYWWPWEGVQTLAHFEQTAHLVWSAKMSADEFLTLAHGLPSAVLIQHADNEATIFSAVENMREASVIITALESPGEVNMQFHKILVREIAAKVCERLCKKLIRVIQRQNPGLLAGSGLNFWDEICVEIRRGGDYEESCKDHLLKNVKALVSALSKEEKMAVWLQTEVGEYFNSESTNMAYLKTGYVSLNDAPCGDKEISNFILDKYVMQECMDYTNSRIRDICD